ncbi:MAG: hypothetical protein ACREJG_12890, partial [Candidatus Rokuibacteriota bacterium]
ALDDVGYHHLARTEIVRFRGRLLHAAGATVVAAFDGPARAIRCASAIVDGARRLGMTTKAGLHTGECEVGPDGLSGPAVEVARHVAREAAAGDVAVTTTVKDLVCSPLFRRRRPFPRCRRIWTLTALGMER